MVAVRRERPGWWPPSIPWPPTVPTQGNSPQNNTFPPAENWGLITTAVTIVLLAAYATLFIQDQITAAGHPVSTQSFSEVAGSLHC